MISPSFSFIDFLSQQILFPQFDSFSHLASIFHQQIPCTQLHMSMHKQNGAVLELIPRWYGPCAGNAGSPGVNFQFSFDFELHTLYDIVDWQESVCHISGWFLHRLTQT